MRWIADENVEQPIVEYLRTLNHDVKSVSEQLSQASDKVILETANIEKRTLLTNDKDFGELAFLGQKVETAIVLMRFRTEDSSKKRDYLAAFIKAHLDSIYGKFVVLRESGARIKGLR